MPYITQNYVTNSDAPVDTWVCTRTSNLGPFPDVPPSEFRHSPDFCGQCVSFVTRVCPSVPVSTSLWRRGALVQDNAAILRGTVVATFDKNAKYSGHAAIYVSQSAAGIQVYDQWVNGHAPQPISPRLIRWDGRGISNNGASFYVVEP